VVGGGRILLAYHLLHSAYPTMIDLADAPFFAGLTSVELARLVSQIPYATAIVTVSYPDAPSGSGSTSRDVWSAPWPSVARTLIE
jgi:hypothetical protein